jgi:PAS domain S-box-containing protein
LLVYLHQGDVVKRGCAVNRLEETGLFQALSRAGDGALVADTSGRIVYWNPAAQRLLGWGAGEAVGRPCCDLLEGRDGNGEPVCRDDSPVIAAARYGQPVEDFDIWTRTKAGRLIRLNVSTLAVPSERSAGTLTIHLFRDVTGRAPARRNGGHASEPRPETTPASGPLTRRELEVLRLLATGTSTRAAADRLGVSLATVRNHVQNLLGKLGVHSRLQAVAHATNHGLL